MNRSAQPLPFDARTKDGDESIPSQRISSWKAWLTYCDPLSWRIVRPVAAPSPMAPNRSAHPLADRLQRFEARASLGGVQTHANRRAMVFCPRRRRLRFPVAKAVVVMSVPHISSTHRRE